KLLPGIEFINLSNRGAGISYQEYLGEPVQLANIIHILVTNLVSNGISASVGVIGFILLLFSLRNYKKRYIMFSLALVAFSILMAVKGIVADIFFKITVFSQLRHIERAVFLAAFASSILAGAGLPIFLENIRKFMKIKREIIVFSAVVLLILVELLFLQKFPQSNDIIKPDDIEINDYISNDNSRFRTINLALSTLIGASGYNYLSQLGIGTIKGGSGIWFNDYLLYLTVAQQSNPAKLWGLLNNKYVISDRELDMDGLKFINKFNECEKCPIGEVDGPYLYENLQFMPRAYFVDKGILVVGDRQESERAVYSLILNENFDPKKAVIVSGKSNAGQYSLEVLKKYYAIMVSGTLDSSQVGLLRDYASSGGILLPNIFDGKNSVSEDDIKGLFSRMDGKFEEIEISEYEGSKASYNVRGKKGFLVLSERFSNFPGWEAAGKGSKDILVADGITTAVFVDNDEKITFKYRPKSFRDGLLVSMITLIILIFYFAYPKIKGIGGKNKD
ncbi:hypothetical protein HYU09_05555, partial [Candidatus Woesearchaeota archaeon]|nr:hypothetical protein [Candidatus Woesearchaeota archaeon]